MLVFQQSTNITEATTNIGQSSTVAQNESSPPVSPLPLLLPGEVVKFSGKYSSNISNSGGGVTQPKNIIKDEVVIRNADSGKGKMGDEI